MKKIYKVCGKVSLAFYLFMLYQLWHLCQYGGLRRHILMLALGMAGFGVTFILWLISRRHTRQEASEDKGKKKNFMIEILIVMIATFFFGGCVIYSAIPYHGALSWKMDEWMREKRVKLEHNNIFEYGLEGILKDLEEALDLPEELYIANKCQVTFDKNGTIQSIYAFLYGKNEAGEKKTYLIDYDADKSHKMTVWTDGNVNGEYDEGMRLSPMIEILNHADWKNQVKSWSETFLDQQIYELLYFGRRAFDTKTGLQYVPGDADDSEAASEINPVEQLISAGGSVVGFEVSLHIPGLNSVTPVRYIMEPEYVSQEELNRENTAQQVDKAKDTDGWIIDQNNGMMYFLLDDNNGWRLVITDAAAGSRFYIMERTMDGGITWECINEDPFNGQSGVAEGLIFYDESFGIAGLTGASQSFSALYITRDGGKTFEKLELPVSKVTELPESAERYGHTLKDYDYLNMPNQDDVSLTVTVTTDAWEKDGLVFQSNDNGATWEFAGVIPKVN